VAEDESKPIYPLVDFRVETMAKLSVHVVDNDLAPDHVISARGVQILPRRSRKSRQR
jgi:hypothetical protein